MVVFFADLVCFENYTIADDGNLRRFWNFPQQDIASFPSGASCCRGKRFSLFDDVGDKEALGNNDKVVHLIAVVVQEEKAGVIKRGDAVYHGAIDAVVDLGVVFICAGALAFQLVLSLAIVAYVVLDRGVGFGFLDGNSAADGAVHVAGEPVFGEDAGLLGRTFVAVYQGGVES